MRLHDYLDHRAATAPDAELAVLGPRVVTGAEAAAWVDGLAASLVRSGLAVGARVGLLAKNSVELGLAYYAASKAGVVAVPLNYRLVPREWAYILGDAAVEAVFAQSEYVDGIDSIRDQLPEVRHLVCIDGEHDGWEPMAGWLDAPALDRSAQLARSCDDVYQMYTSGTTGRPKGVVISQDALLCTLMQWRLTLPLARGERALIVAPVYHVSGALNLFHAVASGGSVYLMREFDASEAARVLDEERIGYVMLVPAMIQSILTDVPDAGARDYPDLRTILYGGSAISEATLRRALDVFGCDLVQAFGMTELPKIGRA